MKKLSEINAIQVEVYPRIRNIVDSPLEQTVQVPGTFPIGGEWEIKHTCKSCNSNISVSNRRLELENSSWFFMHYSSRRSLPDVQLMDKIGGLFKLDLSTDFSGDQPGSYRVYTLTGIHKSLATIAYYQCPPCKSQYMIALAQTDSNEVYVEKILQVHCNYDLFKMYDVLTLPPRATQYTYLGLRDTHLENHKSAQKGCTPEEVDQLEQRWGVKFPSAYREVYLVSGYDSGFRFHGGNEYDLKDYRYMRQKTIEDVRPEDRDLFDENAFIFSVNAEYEVFWFFMLDEGDDPPVYKYDFDGIELVYDRLSDCIKEQAWYRYHFRKD